MFTITFRADGEKKSRRLARVQTPTDSASEALAFASKVMASQKPAAQSIVTRVEITRLVAGNAAVTWEAAPASARK